MLAVLQCGDVQIEQNAVCYIIHIHSLTSLYLLSWHAKLHSVQSVMSVLKLSNFSQAEHV